MAKFFFPFVLLALLFLMLVIEHFLPPIPGIGARILLMPLIIFYASVALPYWAALPLVFCGGLMWDLLHVQYRGEEVEVAVGFSVILYAVLAGVMSGFRPWFLRGRWEVHCLLCGLFTGMIPLAEYLMISVRRLPMEIAPTEATWWRIGGTGIAAAFLAPFFFFGLNYCAALLGYDLHPDAHPATTSR